MRWTEQEYQDFLERTGANDVKHIPKAREILMNIGRPKKEDVIIRLNDEQPEPKFKSKTEQRAWSEWVPTTKCIEAFYEPMRLYLNSGSYRPDFALRMPDRTLWLIEVKGNWNAYKSGRSSKKSLKEAARMYWWLARFFSLLPKKGGGWKLEEIK